MPDRASGRLLPRGAGGQVLGKREVPGSVEEGSARQGREGARQQDARQGWLEGMQVEGG